MKPSFARETARLTRREFARLTAALPVFAAMPWARAAESTGEEERIIAALPARAPVQPARRRRLLIFDLNVNYGGHRSIRTANRAFTLMGEKTGAFETVVSRDPEVFQ